MGLKQELAPKQIVVDSHPFKESSAQWLDYITSTTKKDRLNTFIETKITYITAITRDNLILH